MASFPSVSPQWWTYDVFVSFRGEDIRKNFIDHLFTDFNRQGIHVFRDDKQVKKGQEISPKLYEAIENSRFLIVIFSKNYAMSTWCLRELVKILECKDADNKYEVRTIFYDVKPSVVRSQTGSYAEAFKKHVISNTEEVPTWNKALNDAADLSGWELQDMANGYEAKFIDKISRDISRELSEGPLDIGENLVGLRSRMEKMNLLRFVGSGKVNMIGICGTGGIGKTTIARAIFNLLYIYFEGSSFCEDVKGATEQPDLIRFQKQLLADITNIDDLKISSVSQGTRVLKQRMVSKRVLIVLDDVDRRNKLEALAGNHNWFGEGSVIVVTGRDRQLLNAHGVDVVYEIECLEKEDALELFSLYAFRRKCPQEEFVELSYRVVHYANGLPLALKVLGCFLYNKTVREWKGELEKLQTIANLEIHQVLRLSYDGLDRNQRSAFLDIVCFFRGEDESFVRKILDGCNLFADTNIRALVDKSLLAISQGRVVMHDLIQEMGREIVREESEDVGKRSRLWLSEDVCYVLDNKKGTEAVQGLVLNLSCSEAQIRSETFARMENLRILNLYHNHMVDDYDGTDNIKCKTILQEHFKACGSSALKCISNELRLFRWHGYPFEFLPSGFYPRNLVVLDFSYANIKQLWTASKSFPKLMKMKLSHCHNLISIPDLTGIPNLEELILENCTNLVEIHPSVGNLKKLLVLNLRNCMNLKNLVTTFESESLRVINLAGCLARFSQESSWSISSFFPFLKTKQSPPSFVLPSFAGLHMLKELDISYRNLSVEGLNGITSLPLLEELNLSGSSFRSIPSFGQLSRLRRLGLADCKKLEALPQLPSTIQMVDSHGCTSLMELPSYSSTKSTEYMEFDFTSCQTLAQHLTIESLIHMFLPQGWIDECRILHLFFPGSRIPQWFSSQCLGSRVKLPPLSKHKEFKGIAACVVFAPVNQLGHYNTTVSWEIRNISNHVICGFSYEKHVFPYEIRRIKSDQIWMTFQSHPEVQNAIRKAGYDCLEVSFEKTSLSLELKECGARFLYEEDARKHFTFNAID